jgi:glyoxylase-like metal-dependent hydrolase (beta-lactamase superfamily II)
MPATEILRDFFFIERGYLSGNHFVYRSKKPILIDTAYIADFPETARLIADLGTSLSDTDLIIVTHCHCDHIGGNAIIQDNSGCDIALHKIGKHFIDTRDDWSTWWKYYSQEARFFSATEVLEDGDIIAVGPHEFEVFYSPGHSADGIVLYNKKEKVLISSDTLWENDVAVMTIRVEGSRAVFSMIESLERLEPLDVKIAYPGHGSPFTNVREAIARSKKKMQAYLSAREKVGSDLLKKICIYTLLMKKTVAESSFFQQLMSTYWFKETVDLYFDCEYELKYAEVMKGFLQRGIVKRENGTLFTTIKPS